MLKKLAKKYSEFINFPIFLKMEKEVSEEVPLEDEDVLEDADEEEEVDLDDEDDDDVEVTDEEEDDKPKTKTVRKKVWEWERVNDIKAIWYRSKEDIEEDEYSNFYKSISKDYADPLTHIHFIAEGEV
jgi:heat shock protein beta